MEMTPSNLSTDEYNIYYAGYIALLDEIPLLQAISSGLTKTAIFFDNFPSGKWDYRYMEGKWTPKDILQHLIDTERIFAYRALNIARNRDSLLPGFDENLFAKSAGASFKTAVSLKEDYLAVRNASVSLFKSFSNFELCQIGIASEKPISVRALGFLICGHEIHHLNILKERYLK